MSRGIERRMIFLGDDYGKHFLELVGEMSERYTVEVHAYVLMGNHYLCGAHINSDCLRDSR